MEYSKEEIKAAKSHEITIMKSKIKQKKKQMLPNLYQISWVKKFTKSLEREHQDEALILATLK